VASAAFRFCGEDLGGLSPAEDDKVVSEPTNKWLLSNSSRTSLPLVLGEDCVTGLANFKVTLLTAIYR